MIDKQRSSQVQNNIRENNYSTESISILFLEVIAKYKSEL